MAGNPLPKGWTVRRVDGTAYICIPRQKRMLCIPAQHKDDNRRWDTWIELPETTAERLEQVMNQIGLKPLVTIKRKRRKR